MPHPPGKQASPAPASTGIRDAAIPTHQLNEPEVALAKLEATPGWYWAADLRGQCGAHLILAGPLGMQAFAYKRVKKDQSDARLLGDVLRMGSVPEAWIAREIGEVAGAGATAIRSSRPALIPGQVSRPAKQGAKVRVLSLAHLGA